MNENLSPADIKAVIGDNNNGYPMFPYGAGFGNGFGNAFGGDGSWIWFILILALFGGFNGNGNGFGGGFNNDYAWLSNGQKEIMQNTNQGFDTLQLANQLNGINSGVQGISTQLCNGFAGVNQNLCSGFSGVNATVNTGFANAETAANARQMANMNQAFNSEIATLNGFNNINNALQNCCCENRLGIANLNSTILSENCQDRFQSAQNTRDIIENATRNTQAVLDKLCQLELDTVKTQLDAKNDRIADLQREISMKDLAASQIAQTADLRASQATVANQLVSELRSCPIPSQPVYGNQPIFTCNGNGGCGCNGNF